MHIDSLERLKRISSVKFPIFFNDEGERVFTATLSYSYEIGPQHSCRVGGAGTDSPLQRARQCRRRSLAKFTLSVYCLTFGHLLSKPRRSVDTEPTLWIITLHVHSVYDHLLAFLKQREHEGAYANPCEMRAESHELPSFKKVVHLLVRRRKAYGAVSPEPYYSWIIPCVPPVLGLRRFSGIRNSCLLNSSTTFDFPVPVDWTMAQ